MTNPLDTRIPVEEICSGWMRISEAHSHSGMSRTGWRAFYTQYAGELEVSRVGPKVVLVSKASIDACLRRIASRNKSLEGTIFAPIPPESDEGRTGSDNV